MKRPLPPTAAQDAAEHATKMEKVADNSERQDFRTRSRVEYEENEMKISPRAHQQATRHQSVVEHFVNQVQNDVAHDGGCRLARVHGGQMVKGDESLRTRPKLCRVQRLGS